MSVSIKCAIRCRPWSGEPDLLCPILHQDGPESGQITLINTDYSTTAFAFNWAWFSSHNSNGHLKDDEEHLGSQGVAGMEIIQQDKVYNDCGVKIKDEVLDGNAVVLFAYGLSGSGKTYTVFGIDAPDDPKAWFKFSEKNKMWGIFPCMAYDIFSQRKDGWKITMKYFQNVVDIVRDLMSPTGEERMYKEGMRKDDDGFMDVQWCCAKVLADWDDLRTTFTAANARKAIAPTQFNPRSTRGHCILSLEVETPHPEMEGVKQRGRVYVCDLAGTEPAGDIFYAVWKKRKDADGEMEEYDPQPHRDKKKSKELQDQGKKINLSLSEMAGFFMKMSQAMKKKTLKPGKSIPGCNSYFLCKYLKDTMLQARTYLFCGIRPELHFSKYTFSTLNFAKTASAIKLAPKKATGAASPMERKLMAELDEMKKLVASLQASGGGGGGGGDSEGMAKLEAALAQKQEEMAAAMMGNGAAEAEAKMEEQKEEYGTHGIDLPHFNEDPDVPYLINLDEDPFREKRFMYMFREAATRIGGDGDIKPFSFRILNNHCHVDKGEDGQCSMFADAGEVFVNGEKLLSLTARPLINMDRVVLGDEILLFIDPKAEPVPAEEEPTCEKAIAEWREGMAKAAGAGGGDSANAEMERLRAEVAKLQTEGPKSGEKGAPSQDAAAQAQREAAMKVVQAEMLELIPKIQDVTQILETFNRGMIKLEAGLQMTPDKAAIPKVKVNITNENGGETISLDVFEFSDAHSTMRQDMQKMQMALQTGKEYEVDETHDPISLLFDKTFMLGTSFSIMEYLIYMFPTDDEEKRVHIKQSVAPFGNAGFVEMEWNPLGGPNEEDEGKEPMDVVDPSELVGKPWTYELKIKGLIDLPLSTDECYCEYQFNGETFVTENVQQHSNRPTFDYRAVRTRLQS